MTHDVFISHSSKDKPAADAACAALEAQGIRCWVAPRDILPSADWGASIVEAIAGAKVFMLIFSANANASSHITREVERAVAHGLPVIPVRIEDIAPGASLEYFLNTPHWLDAYRPPFDQHLGYLVQVVKLLIESKDKALAPAAAPAGPVAAPVAPPQPAPHPHVDAASLPGMAPPPPSQPSSMPPPSGSPWPMIAAGVVGVLILAVAGFVFLRPHPHPAALVVAQMNPECLVATPAVANPANCQTLLAQASTWEGCAASYADTDMRAHTGEAKRLIAAGQSGADIYSAAPAFRDYGAISHYWEMFGQCVREGYVKFGDISGSVPFPQSYWGRTRGLRRTIGGAWNGAGQGLPDFMSNFQALCLQYKAAREKASPGGGQTLDCSV